MEEGWREGGDGDGAEDGEGVKQKVEKGIRADPERHELKGATTGKCVYNVREKIMF